LECRLVILQPTYRGDLSITIKIRARAATLALLATIVLTVLKFVTAGVSHSVGVFSEGVHSLLDLVSAALSFFTVQTAGKPADEDHPFGHGKIETLSSLFESLLLAVAGGLIIYEGVRHLIQPEPIAHEGLAIGVIVVSIAVSFWVFKHNSRAALDTDSSALHVNALHFLSDVVASAGVLVALVILKFTGWLWIDPLIAVLVGGYILVMTYHQLKKALWELSDTHLPEAEIRTIREILEKREKLFEIRDLRTRKSGAYRHIDFHLVTCGHMTVESSHSVCDEIEAELIEVFPSASVKIHVEPCEKETHKCHVHCHRYQKK
jgi:cation diffusion facilitator family transporter